MVGDVAARGRARGRGRVPSRAVETCVVDHRRHAALVGDLRGDAVGRDDLGDQLADQVLGVGPGDRVEHPDGAGDDAGVRDHVVGRAGAHHAPHHADPGPRVEAAADRMAGSSVTTLPSAKVRSSVRCGREVWPPLPMSRTVSASAAPVSGPSRRPTWPTSRLGSQCRPKTWRDAVERAGGDQVSAPPGMTSSAGWKSSRTRPGSSAAGCDLGEGQAGADEAGGVHVVPAGVGDARRRVLVHGSSVQVVDRQRVEVGAQRDERAARSPMLGDQSAASAAADRAAGLLERGGDRSVVRSSAQRQLGVGVQVAPEVDQVVGVLVDDLGDARGRRRIGGIGREVRSPRGSRRGIAAVSAPHSAVDSRRPS